MKQIVAAALALAATASAQSGAWGQCGGIGWSGDTTCISGWHCVYQNDWYSQCLQGSDTTSDEPTTSTTATTSSTTTTSIPTSTSTEFSSTDGTLFKIDGETGYFAGTNCYWCSFLTNPDDVDSVYENMASSGMKILRIWGFNDVSSAPGTNDVYFQYLSSSGSTINTGTYGLQLLDKNVAAAEEKGIKLIINFVNNWDDYGGMSAYTNAFGGDHVGWYTNSAAQTQYKTYIETLVNRYKDSTAIFAWELANEPRCNGCDVSVIYNWASQISAYIKSLDANHMVTLGDEGFGLEGDGSYPYQYGEGIDFAQNLEIAGLDFGTFHFYPESWSVSTETFGQGWIETHAAACTAAGKPCLFEEYGTTSNHCENESPWQELSVDTEGIAGDSFWQWGDTLSYGQSHDDGHTIFYGSDDWECLVEDHVAYIEASS
ncbi:putative mannan endo-1,4-beta-mannosidase F [Zalerion maritima]|uniref:Mannan endo-1,4-beta-mannosidase A n=1 Tax=Zalerion maritima TaxID=339359 RepID=A0AAD5RQH3_9PEZI|nr:putative mannan endo-1,4-beta-mannosidase F [Zalerion maritima]